jgi:branched-chain amino acid transport system substrate-binding protein
MRVLRRSKSALAAVAVATALLAVGAAVAPGVATAASTPVDHAPGITAHQVQVGALATLSGPIAADFAAIVPGVEAYFDMVNAKGGVDGRKLVLAEKYDDASQATVNAQLARTLVQQNHVFAVVGVATAFFGGASFLSSTSTPTFGYVTEDNWSPAANMFGAYGSLLSFTTTEPFYPYVAKQLGARSVSVIAYNVPQSADGCQAAVDGLEKYGVHIAYADLSHPYGNDLSSDVVHMKQAGTDLVVSCMDETGNIALSRALQQNGLGGVNQLWFDGYDRSELAQYSALMQHTYFLVQHVPFEAAKEFPAAFPGLDTYIATMNRYEPADTYSEVALDGWLSADLFVRGLRAAGPDPTQAGVVRAINRLSAYTAGGLTTPVDWTVGHTKVTSPTCQSFVEAVGTSFKVVFNHGSKIFVCFPTGKTANLSAPVPPPAGTPGG